VVGEVVNPRGLNDIEIKEVEGGSETTGTIDSAVLGFMSDDVTTAVALAAFCSMLDSALEAALSLAASTGRIEVRGGLFAGSFGTACTIPMTLPPPLAAGGGPLSKLEVSLPATVGLDWAPTVVEAAARGTDVELRSPDCNS
jgi:hypothetical protein